MVTVLFFFFFSLRLSDLCAKVLSPAPQKLLDGINKDTANAY